MKICFWTISLLISFGKVTSAVAQVNFTESYYPSVYAAEMDIVDKSYASALSKYQAAFAVVEHPVSVDLVNAAVCASMIDSMHVAYNMLLQLARIGIDKNYLDTCSGFSKIRKAKHWQAFTRQYHEVRHTIQFDDETRILLDSMHVWDQRFRVMPGSYNVYGDTIKKIDSQNIQLFLEIVESKGFPKERMIGREIPGIMPPAYIVLLHHCQARSFERNSWLFDFKDMFTDAVSYGELDPYIATHMLSMQGTFAPRLGPVSVSQISVNEKPSLLYREVPYGEFSIPIDKYRLQFGIETIENYYRKASFFHTDPLAAHFNFRRYGLLNIFNVDQGMYDQIIKLFEPLIK